MGVKLRLLCSVFARIVPQVLLVLALLSTSLVGISSRGTFVLLFSPFSGIRLSLMVLIRVS